MVFIKSNEMKVSVTKGQEKQLSTREIIQKACKDENNIAFDIYDNDILIGFAMLRRFAENSFFLWDYAIDKKHQNNKFGQIALVELIEFMKCNYSMKLMSTTYIWGNKSAKHTYEKIGFVETDVIDEPNCHEVNMMYSC